MEPLYDILSEWNVSEFLISKYFVKEIWFLYLYSPDEVFKPSFKHFLLVVRVVDNDRIIENGTMQIRMHKVGLMRIQILPLYVQYVNMS